MRRTSRRPLPAHTVSPRVRADLRAGAGRRRRPSLMAAFTNWLATALTRRRDRLLRPRLHAVAQADHAAEHLLGRHLRRGAGADRLGRGDRLARPRRPGRCSRSCSSGRCRTSTRWPSSSRTTTRGPASRCCRWWRRCAGSAWRSVVFAWLTVVASLAALAARHGPGVRRRRRSWSARCSWSRRTGCTRRHPARRAGQADAAVPLVDDVPDDRLRRGRGGRPRSYPGHAPNRRDPIASGSPCRCTPLDYRVRHIRRTRIGCISVTAISQNVVIGFTSDAAGALPRLPGMADGSDTTMTRPVPPPVWSPASSPSPPATAARRRSSSTSASGAPGSSWSARTATGATSSPTAPTSPGRRARRPV